MISETERCSVQDEENGPQYSLNPEFMSCDGDEDEVLTEVD